ncbi:Hypothetical predicted protein [Mytilus galloprovincialis]|uniref:Reverse transcriptase domain-containing protein n=1 Tax=Mytilus galloprovincialis TaxID=29158 RepID=A0A8B6HJW8_MYTGA|nr:Hypothetical predicted protein [Mytilus galloprovincialis]
MPRSTLFHPTQSTHIVHPHNMATATMNSHHHAKSTAGPQHRRPYTQFTIGTLNLQNALSNQLYLVNVLKKCDILFVQEHWLYSCDKHKLQEVNDSHVHVCEAKSVDDDLDTEILVRNRGYGGTAVFWRKDIDRAVKFTSDGNDQKLRVIEVQNKIIEELETERNIEIDNTNVLEVQEVIKALKTGKSPGPDGLSAEHFKLMPEELLTYIVQIVNIIFKDKDLPQETKEGVVLLYTRVGKINYIQKTIEVQSYQLLLYKRYNNNILEALERSNIGARIGNINVVAPTCADDIAILASKEHEVQALLLDMINDMTNKDFVSINPTKSEIMPLTKVQQQLNVYLGDNKIDEKNEVKHLGLIRTIKNKVNIEDRLKVARRTIYAMLGPGLSARKGMSPIVSARLWQTYALPRSLYGIEVLNYTKSDITKLERLQLQICRQIQGLPKRVASAANYCLLGIEPIQSTVDRLLLTFFGGIIQDNTSIEYRIIERQLVMSKQNANTFISRLETALSKYKLPKAQELLLVKPTREKWKTTVKCAIQDYWAEKWEMEKSEKSTMKYINIKARPIGNPHQIWKFTSNNTLEVKKAEIKAKLITRTYTLQVDRAKFSRNVEQDMCLLCNSATEDTEHFMLECNALKTEREKHLTTLKSYVKNNIGNKIFEKKL